jgi:hypothetical protein
MDILDPEYITAADYRTGIMQLINILGGNSKKIRALGDHLFKKFLSPFG